jgi:response regulator RpfG family c-di-GMP phosphodiesterase
MSDSAVDSSLTEPNEVELLRTIFTYIAQISNERDLDNLLILLADMGRDLVTADRCTVWLVDVESGMLWSKVAHGLDRISIPKGIGIAGHVFGSGKAFITNDPYNESLFDKEVDEKTGYITRSIIALPIFDSEGTVIGAFQAINKMTKQGAFSEVDQEHLLLAATYVGKELESAILQEEIETTQKELIFTLAEAGEMRLKETGNHVKRVAEYSKTLALHYGLKKQEAELLKLASPMHDIGKIAIPDSILLKPGKLDGDEWNTMQTHAQLGYDLLKQSKRRIFKAASIVARQHHERWGGGGYPRNLKGDSIHPFGRITAVADIFDALGSDRCYKKAWELDRIIDLFKGERGKQFEPELLDAFLDNLKEFVAIRDEYKDEQFT